MAIKLSRRVTGAIACAAFLAAFVAQGPVCTARADDVFAAAYKDYVRGNLESAEAGFKQIVEDSDNPNRERAILKLAEIYEQRHAIVKARDTYKMMIEEYPGSKLLVPVQKKVYGLNLDILFNPAIVEDSKLYEVKSRDTLGKIARENNTTINMIKKCNGLMFNVIVPGQRLKVCTAVFRIMVDKSQNKLFLIKNDEVVKAYDVSTGLNNSTPVGRFTIQEKLEKPVWFKIGAAVAPDDPEYELGTRWMGLSVEGYGIHGTKNPRTIGQQVTKGCVRMLNGEVEELFDIVPSGTEVIIVD